MYIKGRASWAELRNSEKRPRRNNLKTPQYPNVVYSRFRGVPETASGAEGKPKPDISKRLIGESTAGELSANDRGRYAAPQSRFQGGGRVG